VNRHHGVLLRLLAIAACVAAGTALAGCGSSTSSPTPAGASSPAAVTPSSDTASAARVVSAFYRAVGQHDATAARALLSADLAGGEAGPDVASWMQNVVRIDRFSAGTGSPPTGDVIAQHPGYVGLTEVPVSYTATLVEPAGNDGNGPSDRFVLVGQKTAGAPWLILEIASSP
jgi:hypothetical protein